jgi:hypothetical protein
MKPLLDALADGMSVASGEDDRNEATIAWASCLARHGKIAQARQVFAEIHPRYSDRGWPRISVLLMVLESLILFYGDRSESCFDRIRRASKLAGALGFDDVRLLAESWTAHFAFNFGKSDEMVVCLAECMNGFTALDEPARARVSLVVADALQFVGDWELASRWYRRARLHAQACRDHATLSAIEYNRLAIGLSRHRLDTFIGQRDTIDRNWRLELESVVSFHTGVRNESLKHLLVLATARVLEIEHRFAEAATVLEALRDEGRAAALGLSHAALDVEARWCAFRAGGAVPSAACGTAIDRDLEALDADDRLAMVSMLAEMGNQHPASDLLAQRSSLVGALTQSHAQLRSHLAVVDRHGKSAVGAV